MNPEIAVKSEKKSIGQTVYTGILFDKDKWTKKLQKKFAKLLEEIIKVNGEAAIDDLNKLIGKSISKSIVKAVDPEANEMDWSDPKFRDVITPAGRLQMRFDVTSPQVQQFIRERSYQFSFDVNDYSMGRLQEELNDGFERGESIGKLKNRIKDVFGFGEGRRENYRATRIARSEAIRASNYGSIQAWAQSGVVGGKEWFTARDERRCPFCARMHGRIIDLQNNFFNRGDTFSVGEGENRSTINLDYENVSGPPLHPNCRCTLIPKVLREYLEEPKSTEGRSPFSSGEIVEEETLRTGTLNECTKAKIDGDGQGIYKCEETEQRRFSEAGSFYDRCRKMMDLHSCSMARREVMAYEVDRMLDVGLIPETTWKVGKVLNRSGSCQTWIDNFSAGTTAAKEDSLLKSELINASVFDDILANTDRHYGNFGTDANGKLWFIDNGTAFAHTPEKAWNGVFTDMGGRSVIETIFNLSKSGEIRLDAEYVARGRVLANRALTNKADINKMFKSWGLPKEEQTAFWDRIDAFSKGEFFEYKDAKVRKITGGLRGAL